MRLGSVSSSSVDMPDWFHGPISLDDAESRLKAEGLLDGQFLVMQLSDPSSSLKAINTTATYMLVLAFEKTVHQYLIRDNGSGRVELNSEPCTWAKTLTDVIPRLQTSKECGMPTLLTTPCPQPDAFSSLDSSTFVNKGNNRGSQLAIKVTKEKAPKKKKSGHLEPQVATDPKAQISFVNPMFGVPLPDTPTSLYDTLKTKTSIGQQLYATIADDSPSDRPLSYLEPVMQKKDTRATVLYEAVEPSKERKEPRATVLYEVIAPNEAALDVIQVNLASPVKLDSTQTAAEIYQDVGSPIGTEKSLITKISSESEYVLQSPDKRPESLYAVIPDEAEGAAVSMPRDSKLFGFDIDVTKGSEVLYAAPGMSKSPAPTGKSVVK